MHANPAFEEHRYVITGSLEHPCSVPRDPHTWPGFNVCVVGMSERQDLRIAGISLDRRDPALPAAFYAEVLGGRALWTNADCAGVEATGLVLMIQRVSDHVPPTWPGTPVIHLDLAVGLELEASVAFAVAARANKTAYQPDPR